MQTARQTAFQGQRCTPTCCCCLCQSRCLHDNRPNYRWGNSNGFFFYSFFAGKLCKVSVLICTPYSELCSYSMTSSSTNILSHCPTRLCLSNEENTFQMCFFLHRHFQLLKGNRAVTVRDFTFSKLTELT